MAPFIIWCRNQAAAIDEPGAYWNPFMFKINNFFMSMIFLDSDPLQLGANSVLALKC